MIARSIGAAPRQRGSSDGWTLRIGHSESSGSRISWPKAQTTSASGPRGADPLQRASSLTSSVCSSSIPSSRGRLGDRRRLQRRPRPRRRSGGVTTSAGACGEAPAGAGPSPRIRGAEVDGPHASVRGSRWSRSRARPRSSSLERRAVAAALAQRPQRSLALRRAGPVEDQDAVEVVDLVLEDPRLEARGLEQDRLAVGVEAADAGVQRALDVDRDPRQAEAALLGDGPPRRRATRPPG